MATPYYQDEAVTIYHGDCREILPTLDGRSIRLVLSDPPYGMNCDTDSTRFSGGDRDSVARRGVGKISPRIVGDDEPFDPTPWLDFPEVILWGSNHFASRLPVGTTLVWIKRLDPAFGSFLSDAELAWMKGGHGVYCWRDLTMMAEAKHRVHPSQKPEGLMQWCLSRVGKSWTIGAVLDPYMGSGTTLRACKNRGLKAIGIEIEERYCEIAAKRMSQSVMNFSGGK